MAEFKYTAVTENVIAGITPFDANKHINKGSYQPRVPADADDAVLVAEVVTARILSTRTEGGHPLGRLAMFTRLISETEHQKRLLAFQGNPDTYYRDLLVNTAH